MCIGSIGRNILLKTTFRTTEHRWCGMGVSDPDSGKLLGHHTRISANRHLPSHQCRCGRPKAHIHSLRMEKTSEERSSGGDSPHQHALQSWATEVLHTVELKSGGRTLARSDRVRNATTKENHYDSPTIRSSISSFVIKLLRYSDIKLIKEACTKAIT